MRELFKTSRFTRDIKKLPSAVQIDAYEISLKLLENPLDKSLNIKYLTGYKKIFRVIVFTDYRMIYSFDETSVLLQRIGHRKEIYKSLEI